MGHALAIAIEAAVGEEIVLRGVVYRRLEERLGAALALLVSASVFGLMHAGNPGANWVSTLAIALESGLLLGLAYAATRSLWLPIGLHFGWGFTEGGIFGAAVSGGKYSGLIDAPLAGPPWVTGGAFGPEASVAALVISLAPRSHLRGMSCTRAPGVARVGGCNTPTGRPPERHRTQMNRTASPAAGTTPHARPSLSFWQIWNMCFGFLGGTHQAHLAV